MARVRHISLVNIQDKQGIVRYSTDSRELGKEIALNYGIIKEDNEIIVTHVVSESNSSIGSVSVFIERDLMLSDTHKLLAQIAIGLFVMIFILAFLTKGLVESLVSARLSKLDDLIDGAVVQGYFLNRASIDRFDEVGEVIFGFNQLLSIITQVEANQLEKDHGFREAQVQKSMRLKLEEALEQLKRTNENLNRKCQAQDLLMQASHSLAATVMIVCLQEKVTIL